MSIKKLLFPLLLVIGGLAFIYRLFARMLATEAPASKETPLIRSTPTSCNKCTA